MIKTLSDIIAYLYQRRGLRTGSTHPSFPECETAKGRSLWRIPVACLPCQHDCRHGARKSRNCVSRYDFHWFWDNPWRRVPRMLPAWLRRP